MAKMIKCPTCGTQIEVPPQAAGQIVKCPGCGKGLKLVAKAKPGAGAGQAAGTSGSPGGSVAGGSIGGSSVSAMTFVGDLPPAERPGPAIDDLPSLDSNCAVCGRPTDPNDLVEDNGRLVCPDCIKGARSGIARAEGGAEEYGFRPSDLPVKRGKLIQITPSFIGGSVAALVFVACTIVMQLELVKKPVGTLTPGQPTRSTSGGTVATMTDPETGLPVPAPANGNTTAPPATAPTGESPTAAAPTVAAPTTPDGTPTTPATTPGTESPTAATPTSNPTVAIAPTSPDGSIFTDPGTEKPLAATGPAAVPPPPVVVGGDPIDRGMQLLLNQEYPAALREFEAARNQYVAGRNLSRLNAKQQMALEGLAAAAIGTGDAERANAALNTVVKGGRKTRPLALNRAIAVIMKRDSTFMQLGQAANDLKVYLDSAQDDEYAANLFGTLLSRAAATSTANAERVAPFWNYLDQYNDRMAKGEHEGKLKWGVEWLPADEVKTYRLGRPAILAGGAAGALTKAARELESANAAVAAAEVNLKRSADTQGATKQLDAAKLRQAAAQKAFDEASAATKYKAPRWLEKKEEFEPVSPEQLVDPPGAAGPMTH